MSTARVYYPVNACAGGPRPWDVVTPERDKDWHCRPGDLGEEDSDSAERPADSVAVLSPGRNCMNDHQSRRDGPVTADRPVTAHRDPLMADTLGRGRRDGNVYRDKRVKSRERYLIRTTCGRDICAALSRVVACTRRPEKTATIVFGHK